MDIYDGPMLASHPICQILGLNGSQFSDEQMKRLMERQVVLGTAFDSWMLCLGWIKGKTSTQVIGIGAAADHLAHIC